MTELDLFVQIALPICLTIGPPLCGLAYAYVRYARKAADRLAKIEANTDTLAEVAARCPTGKKIVEEIVRERQLANNLTSKKR